MRRIAAVLLFGMLLLLPLLFQKAYNIALAGRNAEVRVLEGVKGGQLFKLLWPGPERGNSVLFLSLSPQVKVNGEALKAAQLKEGDVIQIEDRSYILRFHPPLYNYRLILRKSLTEIFPKPGCRLIGGWASQARRDRTLLPFMLIELSPELVKKAVSTEESFYSFRLCLERDGGVELRADQHPLRLAGRKGAFRKVPLKDELEVRLGDEVLKFALKRRMMLQAARVRAGGRYIWTSLPLDVTELLVYYREKRGSREVEGVFLSDGTKRYALRPRQVYLFVGEKGLLKTAGFSELVEEKFIPDSFSSERLRDFSEILKARLYYAKDGFFYPVGKALLKEFEQVFSEKGRQGLLSYLREKRINWTPPEAESLKSYFKEARKLISFMKRKGSWEQFARQLRRLNFSLAVKGLGVGGGELEVFYQHGGSWRRAEQLRQGFPEVEGIEKFYWVKGLSLPDRVRFKLVSRKAGKIKLFAGGKLVLNYGGRRLVRTFEEGSAEVNLPAGEFIVEVFPLKTSFLRLASTNLQLELVVKGEKEVRIKTEPDWWATVAYLRGWNRSTVIGPLWKRVRVNPEFALQKLSGIDDIWYPERWRASFAGIKRRFFKKVFNLDFRPASARILRLSIEGIYKIYINGKRISRGEDFAAHLREGKNVLAVEVSRMGLRWKGLRSGLLFPDGFTRLKVRRQVEVVVNPFRRKRPVNSGTIRDRDGFSLPVLVVEEGDGLLRKGDEIPLESEKYLVFLSGGKVSIFYRKGKVVKKAVLNFADSQTSDYITTACNQRFRLGQVIAFNRADGKEASFILKQGRLLRVKAPGKIYRLSLSGKSLVVSLNGKPFARVEDGGRLRLEGVKLRAVFENRGVLACRIKINGRHSRIYPSLITGLLPLLGMPAAGIDGAESIFSPFLSGPDPADLVLTVDDDLQKLVLDELGCMVERNRRREEREAEPLLRKIEQLRRRQLRLYALVRREGAKEELLRELEALEGELAYWRHLYRKKKNPFYEAAAVILNREGEVLAAASWPVLPPVAEKVKEALEKGGSPERLPLVNRCWKMTYSPGSTIKILDSAAFLEGRRKNLYLSRLLRKGFPFYGPGSENLRGKKLLNGKEIDFDLRNFRGERVKERRCSLEDAFAHSYNVYFAYLGLHSSALIMQDSTVLEDPKAFLLLSAAPPTYAFRNFPPVRYAEKLLFNHSIDLAPLPPEISAYLRRSQKDALTAEPSSFPLNAYTPAQIAMYSIGQSDVFMSPLQGALLALSVMRKGELRQPTVIKELVWKRSGKKEAIRPIQREWRVFSSSTASYIKKAMNRVVLRGTAARIFSRWEHKRYLYAKTGTAQTNLYKDHSWFVGFFEGKGLPSFAFAVVVPRSGTGAEVAGLLTRRLVDKIIYLERVKERLRRKR